jgi:hypothetical protein
VRWPHGQVWLYLHFNQITTWSCYNIKCHAVFAISSRVIFPCYYINLSVSNNTNFHTRISKWKTKLIGIEMNLTLCWLCDGWEQKQILIMHGHEWVRSTPLIAFYSASSLKQQSTDRHVAPLRHILLIPSQPVFALSP